MTRKRVVAHRSQHGAGEAGASATPNPLTKLDRIAALLLADGGASIAEMTAATGWQPHSVRGAMSGALARRGLEITSHKIDGVRRYHAVRA